LATKISRGETASSVKGRGTCCFRSERAERGRRAERATWDAKL
jgi:hypothetical protein